MPIYKINHKGKIGYKYGKSGKVYFGKDSRKKALKQMKAIKVFQDKLKK